jgi:hypothetical protein
MVRLRPSPLESAATTTNCFSSAVGKPIILRSSLEEGRDPVVASGPPPSVSGRRLVSRSGMMTAVAMQPRPPRHRIKVRHRRDLWVVSCSCGWTVETASTFMARLEERRHVETYGRVPGPASGRERREAQVERATPS